MKRGVSQQPALKRSFRVQRSELGIFLLAHCYRSYGGCSLCCAVSISSRVPIGFGNSFDATRRLKCLGLRRRSSWDEQSQQYRETENMVGKWKRVSSASEADTHLASPIPSRGDPWKGGRRELDSLSNSSSYALKKGSHENH